MKVVATRLGYYNLKRRMPGDEFDIPEGQFSSKWMDKVDSGKAKSKPKASEKSVAKEESLDESEVI